MQNFSIQTTMTQYLEMSILFSICHRQFSPRYSISHCKNRTHNNNNNSSTNTDITQCHRTTNAITAFVDFPNTHTDIRQEFSKLRAACEAFLCDSTRVWLPFQMRMISMNLLSETANAVILIVPSSTTVAHQYNQSGRTNSGKVLTSQMKNRIEF